MVRPLLLLTIAPATLEAQHRYTTHTEIAFTPASWQLYPRTSEFRRATAYPFTIHLTRHRGQGPSFGAYFLRALAPTNNPAPGLTAFGGEVIVTERNGLFGRIRPIVTISVGAMRVDSGTLSLLVLSCDRDGRCSRGFDSYENGWLGLGGMDLGIRVRLFGALELTADASARVPVQLFGLARAGTAVIPGLQCGVSLGR